jgi:23S rRNA pseudouridine2605 synthase
MKKIIVKKENSGENRERSDKKSGFKPKANSSFKKKFSSDDSGKRSDHAEKKKHIPFETNNKRSQPEKPERKRVFKKESNDRKESFARETGKNNFGKENTSGSKGSGIRLNKYIANAGICSRREADKLIESGAVTVNGVFITQLGTKVQPNDVVQFGGQTLKSERFRYILLNKPKDFITTLEDPEDRKTVMNLIKDACKERVYPVGRLDRNTTGLLLFTNDGELAKKLTHPRYNVKKVYHVELEQKLAKADMLKTIEGFELDDGFVKVDRIEYVGDGEDKKIVGVEIHSGKNRIVRRIFEHLGYKVKKLDRTVFAGLTKLNLPRGRWRFLTEEEVNILRRIR